MNEEILINVSENEDALAGLLFQRLSPMLVLRILPLKAFNHPSSKELYGSLLDDSTSGQSFYLLTIFFSVNTSLCFPLLLVGVVWKTVFLEDCFSSCHAFAGESQDQERVSTITGLLLERYNPLLVGNRYLMLYC